MVRNAGALSARVSYVAADWSITPLAAGECYPSAGLVVPSSGTTPAVTTHPTYTPSCGSTSAVLTTAGTEGFVGGNSLAYQWYFVAPGNATWTAVTDGGIYSGAPTATLAFLQYLALLIINITVRLEKILLHVFQQVMQLRSQIQALQLGMVQYGLVERQQLLKLPL